ncbi:MAG: glycosyltransferase family 39 protein [Methanocellales archaeon]|nr:glycosyltransferase family 39 protein [Methanocellales archaeon]MDD3291867.1 glycosyltransferase family 39 protein [Methanocellales archaeon]MDD5235510.1 glycosyltransferase family 39 protein [Methanocellales archaeon]MDD5485129.1 glycosyltransferase family 39 protein [Methanocellales archaeon]
MTIILKKKYSLIEKSTTTSELLLSLLLIYLTVTIIKIFFVLQIPSPFIFSDETAYSKMALSFFESKTFSLWGVPAGYPPPLYPVILSISYIFGDITAAYPVMKVINAFLSSLIIIPVFLIADEFISIKKSLIVAFLSSLLPASFSFTSTIMSENLFYPLFMFSLFFMMKSIIEDDKKWDILCGLFIGLSILTRMPGLALLIILLFALLVKGIYTILPEDGITVRIKIGKIFQAFIDKWCIFLSSAVVAFPWLLRNGYYFGFTSYGLTGESIGMAGGIAKYGGSQPTNIPIIDFIYWAAMHIGYFIFATGIIFFALAMLQTWKIVTQKPINKTTYVNIKLKAFILISWVSFTTLVLLCAYHKFHGGNYLMGRYLDPILPAFIIMGAVGLDSFTKRDFKPFFGTLIVCSVVLVFIPINSMIRAFNTPDAYILLVPQRLYEMDVLSFEPNVIFIKLFLLILPFFFLILAKKNALKWKCIAPLLLIFFVTGSMLASGVMYAASTDAQDEMKVGLWLHNHAPKNSAILFDERDADRMNWAMWGTMFWTDNIIKIGNVSAVEADYVVSLHRLNLPLVLEVGTETEVIRSYNNHYFVYRSK